MWVPTARRPNTAQGKAALAMQAYEEHDADNEDLVQSKLQSVAMYYDGLLQDQLTKQ